MIFLYMTGRLLCEAHLTSQMWKCGKNKPNWKLNAGNNISLSSHWSYARCRMCCWLLSECLLSVSSGHLQIGNFTTILDWGFIWHETLQPRVVISWPLSEWGKLASNVFGTPQVLQVLGSRLPVNPSLREVSPLLEFAREVFPTDVKSSLKGHRAANLG